MHSKIIRQALDKIMSETQNVLIRSIEFQELSIRGI